MAIETDKLYDAAKYETAARDLWQEHNVYAFKPTNPEKVFSIDTPPPTVSGTLHIGHVFSYTHADLMARYKRMRGYHVFYPMGFDDNGLATIRFVEKKNATKAHLHKRSDFIALCLKETHEAEQQFEALWRRISLSIDWTKIYSTISAPVRRASQHSFIDLYNKKLIYRKQEPALYCTTCRTSVAQAELESDEITTTFNNIQFTTESGDKLTIATTRPELLPACVAVFFHPDDVRYQKYSGQFAITPVFEKPVRIMPDEKVDPAKGTGLVMCCTFGDQTDIYWFKTYKLPFVQVVGFDGKWTADSGPLAGLTVHEARKKVLELLKESGTLLEQKTITHNVNTHERCHQEIEYLILTQWFIKILDHKEAFLRRADEINWYPSFMKARYKDWVQNLNWDWCISRQKPFGIPFPVWHCSDCGQEILAETSSLPIDPQEQAYPGGACPSCKGTNLKPDTDVMDTWNTSSLTPDINLHWPDQSPDKLTMPMSMRPQAHDIIRTWAFYTIVKAHYHHNTIPWQNIMISGHVLAGKEKISKSKENSKMTPEALLTQYPADVVRYWASNGRLGADTAYSENQLKIGQRLVTKLWNAFRFIGEHTAGIQPTGHLDTLKSPLNQWIAHTWSATYASFQRNFEEYEYQSALESIEKFFWQDFCDNYLELVKDQFFNPDQYTPQERQETATTLHEIGFGLLQTFAPFLPHLTETLYQAMYVAHEKTVSLHITILDDKRFSCTFEQSATLIAAVLAIVASVRKLKSEKQLSLKTDLESLTVYTNLSALATQSKLIAGITKAKAVTFQVGEPENLGLVEEGGTWKACVKA